MSIRLSRFEIVVLFLYFTIYPDGIGVRTVDIHGDKDYYHDPEGFNIGFHDTQFLSEAGTRPEDNINPQALTIVSSEGKVTELDWSDNHPLQPAGAVHGG